MIVRSALVFLVLLAAAPSHAQSVVAVGDSIIDWNGQGSIPARLSRELGLPVDDRSVAGARISAGFWAACKASISGPNPAKTVRISSS